MVLSNLLKPSKARYSHCTGINTEINGETQQEYRADSDFWFGHTWAHPHAGVYEDATKTYKITANGLVGDLVTTSSSSAGDSSEG